MVGLTTLSNLDACFRHQRLGIIQGQLCSEGVQGLCGKGASRNRKLYTYILTVWYSVRRARGQRLDVSDMIWSVGMSESPS